MTFGSVSTVDVDSSLRCLAHAGASLPGGTSASLVPLVISVLADLDDLALGRSCHVPVEQYEQASLVAEDIDSHGCPCGQQQEVRVSVEGGLDRVEGRGSRHVHRPRLQVR